MSTKDTHFSLLGPEDRANDMRCRYCGGPMDDEPYRGCCGESWAKAAITREESDAQDD